MLYIHTSPKGREALLSNLTVRNALHGKYTIIVDRQDSEDEKAQLTMVVDAEWLHLTEEHQIVPETIHKLLDILVQRY